MLHVGGYIQAMRLTRANLVSSTSILRLLLSRLAFSNYGQMVVGLSLLYTFRVQERLMGTAKFASFVLIVTVLSLAVDAFMLLFVVGGGSPSSSSSSHE